MMRPTCIPRRPYAAPVPAAPLRVRMRLPLVSISVLRARSSIRRLPWSIRPVFSVLAQNHVTVSVTEFVKRWRHCVESLRKGSREFSDSTKGMGMKRISHCEVNRSHRRICVIAVTSFVTLNPAQARHASGCHAPYWYPAYDDGLPTYYYGGSYFVRRFCYLRLSHLLGYFVQYYCLSLLVATNCGKVWDLNRTSASPQSSASGRRSRSAAGAVFGDRIFKAREPGHSSETRPKLPHSPN